MTICYAISNDQNTFNSEEYFSIQLFSTHLTITNWSCRPRCITCTCVQIIYCFSNNREQFQKRFLLILYKLFI